VSWVGSDQGILLPARPIREECSTLLGPQPSKQLGPLSLSVPGFLSGYRRGRLRSVSLRELEMPASFPVFPRELLSFAGAPFPPAVRRWSSFFSYSFARPQEDSTPLRLAIHPRPAGVVFCPAAGNFLCYNSFHLGSPGRSRISQGSLFDKHLTLLSH